VLEHGVLSPGEAGGRPLIITIFFTPSRPASSIVLSVSGLVLGAEFPRIEWIAGNVERGNLKAAALDRVYDCLALAGVNEQFVDAQMWR